MRYIFLLFLTVLLQSLPQYVLAQEETAPKKKTKIKLLNADEGEYLTKDEISVQILKGHVKFKHNKTYMYCDSAYLYPSTNTMRAWGNVKIEEPGKMEMTGDSLFYDGNTKKGKLRGNIHLTDSHQELTTNFLDFELDKNLAYYSGGGRIVNARDQSVLTSRQGYYYTNSEQFFFKDSVNMTTPDYNIQSDTLEYHGQTEITYFHGPTTIVSDSSSIYCENGWYDKLNKKSSFTRHVVITSKEQILKGDSILANQRTNEGRAYGNVAIIDTLNKVEIRGDFARYNQRDSTSLVTGNMLMIMAFADDSLYLHADTLISDRDSTQKYRVIHAFHHVKFFKPDMQGKCDSMQFSEVDSTIRMYFDPVVWSDSNQITGEEIVIKNYDGKIDYMEVTKNAYIISKEDSGMYNQVKGKSLFAKFRNNELYKIDVNRNGQTIYYARDEQEKIMGMNRLVCSDMTIYMDSSRINNIRFYNQPEGTFYPIKDLTEEVKYFRYFKWRNHERPRKQEDIFIWE